MIRPLSALAIVTALLLVLASGPAHASREGVYNTRMAMAAAFAAGAAAARAQQARSHYAPAHYSSNSTYSVCPGPYCNHPGYRGRAAQPPRPTCLMPPSGWYYAGGDVWMNSSQPGRRHHTNKWCK